MAEFVICEKAVRDSGCSGKNEGGLTGEWKQQGVEMSQEIPRTGVVIFKESGK